MPAVAMSRSAFTLWLWEIYPMRGKSAGTNSAEILVWNSFCCFHESNFFLWFLYTQWRCVYLESAKVLESTPHSTIRPTQTRLCFSIDFFFGANFLFNVCQELSFSASISFLLFRYINTSVLVFNLTFVLAYFRWSKLDIQRNWLSTSKINLHNIIIW